ncbi:MAG TPA: phosphotransferase [Roseiflexaceae bacterium]|nr:phosphotransferase [Roseiflexaceae bacterium]
MTVATTSDEPYAVLISAAQTLLSATLTTPVRLSRAERLTDEDRRNVVLRCMVNDAPYGQPASVIIKQVVSEQYHPDDTDSWDVQRFFRDWAGAQFLTMIAPQAAHGPRFYAGDRAQGFVMLEDLGTHHSLVEPLLGTDAAYAEQALGSFARRLGQMHAATIGAADRFEQLTHAINPSQAVHVPAACLKQANDMRTQMEQLRGLLESIGVPVAAHITTELDQICASVAHPGDFLAYVHGDPCPDNIFFSMDRLLLIDFEFGHFGHALRDAVYGRMFFPTCWCANQIPMAVVERMEQQYRAELLHVCPAAHDDHVFSTELVRMCGFWLIGTLGWHLAGALQEDTTWGIATIRSRLIGRLHAFLATASAYNQLPTFCALVYALLEQLQKRWPDTAPFAVYPAFR